MTDRRDAAARVRSAFTGAASGRGRLPYRERVRWGRWWGVVLVAILAVPLLVWSVSWTLQGWVPQGDEGWIALKTHDVFTAHPPLEGMRSTSALTWPGVFAHHPGPMQFYLLAVPYAVTGYHPSGLIAGSFLLGVGLIAVAVRHAWVAGRHNGVAAVVVAVIASEVLLGPSLVLPWNPWPPVLAGVALLALAWRLLLGQVQALPWFVAVSSLVLQANLALVAMLLPLLVVLGCVGLCQWHRLRGATWPLPGWRPRDQQPVWRRPGVMATGVGALCWAPAVVELFVVSPNNLTELWAIGTREMHGLARPLAVVLFLGACWWSGRRIVQRDRESRRSTAHWTSGLVAVGVLAAIASGGLGRLVYLLMMFGGIVFAAAVWLDWWPVARRIRIVPPFGWFAAGLVFAIGVGPGGPGALVFTSNEMNSIDEVRPVVREVSNALHSQGIRGGPIVIHADGPRSSGSYVEAAIVRLTIDGYTLYYDSGWPNAEDDAYRRTEHAPADAVQLTVSDDKPPIVTVPSGRS